MKVSKAFTVSPKFKNPSKVKKIMLYFKTKYLGKIIQSK